LVARERAGILWILALHRRDNAVYKKYICDINFVGRDLALISTMSSLNGKPEATFE